MDGEGSCPATLTGHRRIEPRPVGGQLTTPGLRLTISPVPEVLPVQQRNDKSSSLLDAQQMKRVIRRMAGEIVDHNGGPADLLLVGIRTRGVPLAQRLATAIAKAEDLQVPQGVLDITLYRDDLSTIAPQPVVRESHLPQIEGKTVVLCDDVLFTGRTVRAALDALLDYGRPRAVRLAVLVDRGHRELPVQADVVGRRVQTQAGDRVEVAFPETDEGREEVRVVSPADGD